MKYVRTTLLSVCLLSSLAGRVVSVAPGEGVQKIADAAQESLQKQFATGVTTRDDVVAQLGAPSTKTVAGNYEIWNYQYVRRAAVGIVFAGVPVGTTKNVTFNFNNASGILQKLEFETHQG